MVKPYVNNLVNNSTQSGPRVPQPTQQAQPNAAQMAVIRKLMAGG